MLAQDGVATVVAPMAEVSIPLDPNAPITLAPPEANGSTLDGSANLVPLEVSLPREVSAKDGQVSQDGTVVYEALEPSGADAAVQVLDDGSVRLQTVTSDSDGPRRFTYDFGTGVTPVVQEDGTVQLLQEIADGVSVEVGVIDHPWAVDSEGRDVATGYEVIGNSLVQTIAPDANAAYPIVADPLLTVGLVTGTIYFNKKETLDFSSAGSALSVCALAAKIPAPAGTVLLAGCVVGGAALIVQANRAKNRSMCLKVKFTLPPLSTWWPDIYGGGYCKW